MKKIIGIALITILCACKGEPKNYATLSGKIKNPHESKTLRLFKGRNFEKIITLEKDGTFKDTLEVADGFYTMQHGEAYGEVFLKNDNESTLSTTYSEFIENLTFDGDAADINNFSVKSYLLSKDHYTEKLIAFGAQTEMENALNNYKSAYIELKKQYANVDSVTLARTDQNIEARTQQIKKFLVPKIAIRTELPKGTPSPTFENYKTINGGTTSLSDLKGKYVYIDIWATWCAPCLKEIPSLKKIEKQYEGKNIQFVSISVDEGRGYKGDAEAAKEGWIQMISTKQLGGLQIIADNGFTSNFIIDYKINTIPRFMLIDPAGNIVSADAPRPSNPLLIEMFNSLNL